MKEFYPYFENTGLTEIHLKCTTPPYDYSAVGGENITLYVPVGCLSVYLDSDFGQGWKEIKEEAETLDDGDFAVLQQLYAATDGAHWTRPWVLGATAAETGLLEGVIIVSGHVAEIDLHDNNLVGSLPASLFTLPALTSINLSGNQLTGDLTTLLDGLDENNVITTIDLGHNQLTGNAYGLMEKLTALTTLKVNYNRIRDCYPTPPTRIKTLALGGQDLTDYVVDGEGNPYYLTSLLNLCFSGESSTDLLPSVLFVREYHVVYEGYYYDSNVDIGLCDDASNPSWQAKLMWRYLGYPQYIFENNSTADGWYRGNNGATLDAFVGGIYGSMEDPSTCHRFKVRLNFEPGDVNFDGAVNLSDMQRLLNVALDKNYYRENGGNTDVLNFTAANLIATDDSINVQDFVACINLLLYQNITPTLARRNGGEMSKLRNSDISYGEGLEAEATLYIDAQGRLVLNSAVPVAALELALADGDVEWASAMNPFSHASREGHHIFYSMFGDELPAGTAVLASTTAGLVAADAVDKDGRRIALSFSQGVTDGIDDNKRETINNKRYGYDLQGRRIVDGRLKPGIYVSDGKKFVVK